MAGKESVRNTTFRIRGVPLSWDISRLQSFLEEHDRLAFPVVKSLAREVHSRSKNGTVTFRDLPHPLASLKPGSPWHIPLPTQPKHNALRDHSLTLDIDFLGITTLSEPSPEDHKIDVVAISGLGGHAFGSFKERGGDHMWLRDSLPLDLVESVGNPSMARVMIWGYNSIVPESKSIQSIKDIATSFRTSLLPLATAPTRPIILVAHSMGGLVVKRALVQLSKSSKEHDLRLLRAIYGIAFFGVPHLGMDIKSLIPMVGDGPNLPLVMSLRDINPQNSSLEEEEFRTALGGEGDSEIVLLVWHSVESPAAKQDEVGKWAVTGPAAILVTPSSATHCRPWENGAEHTCAINRTHSDMVKFHLQDHDYNNALEILKGLALRSIVTTLRSHDIPVERFLCVHEQDPDQDYPGRSFWYREALGGNGSPRGTSIDPHISLNNHVKPVSGRIITCRRVANLQIRGRAEKIDPGRYRSLWIFWFFAGRECPNSSKSIPSAWVPQEPPENSTFERHFPAGPDAEGTWTRDSGWFYPWNLRCSIGRARDPTGFLRQNVDVDNHPYVPPELLAPGYGQQVISPGLWNTLRNTGWREVPGPDVVVGSDGEVFLVVSKDFERKWVGGFSFGGVRLVPH